MITKKKTQTALPILSWIQWFVHSFIYFLTQVYIYQHGQHEADVDLWLINNTMGKDQTTTPGTTCPTPYDECVGFLMSPADHDSEDAGDRAYGLSSLYEKTSDPECWSGLGLETSGTVVRDNRPAVNTLNKLPIFRAQTLLDKSDNDLYPI